MALPPEYVGADANRDHLLRTKRRRTTPCADTRPTVTPSALKLYLTSLAQAKQLGTITGYEYAQAKAQAIEDAKR